MEISTDDGRLLINSRKPRSISAKKYLIASGAG